MTKSRKRIRPIAESGGWIARMFERFVAAAIVFVPFGLYVLCIQVNYEQLKFEDAPYAKSGLFLVALLGAALTYDVSKMPLFMEQSKFDAFYAKLLETWMAIAIAIFATLGAAILFNQERIFPFWFGTCVYVFSIGISLWAGRAAIQTIEVATNLD